MLFLTGAVAAGSSLLMDGSGIDALGKSGDGIAEKVAARTAIAAVAGGTASVLSGGKFANGAITGAFAQLYNAECRHCPRTVLEGGGGSRIGALQGGGGGAGIGIGLGAWVYGQISGAFDSLLNWTMASSSTDSAYSLYRAVGPEELADIQSCQCFRQGPNSYEGKLFAKELSGAEYFLKTLRDPQPTNIVGATIDKQVYDSLTHLPLDGQPSVSVDRSQLGVFNASVMKHGGPLLVK